MIFQGTSKINKEIDPTKGDKFKILYDFLVVVQFPYASIQLGLN